MNVPASSELDKRIFEKISDKVSQIKNKKSALLGHNTERLVMRSPIIKFAAAAIIVCAAVLLSAVLFNKLTTPVYALDETIRASRNIRTCYFERYRDANSDSVLDREVWIEYGDDKEINNVRVNFLKDINSILVWTKDGSQYWWKDGKFVQLFQDELYTSKILYFAKKYDPKNAIDNIKQLKSEDKVQVTIKEPSNNKEPIIAEVEYPENTFLIESSFPRAKEILYIDQTTKLIKQVEVYVFEDGAFKKSSHYNYIDYDKQFDSEIFDLKKEVPSDVQWIDYKSLDIGLEKGGLGEDEIAIKAVKEFLEALIVKDYAKASKIYSHDNKGNQDANEMKWIYGVNIVEIISIEQPVLIERFSNARAVSCKVKIIDSNGDERIATWKLGVAKFLGISRWCAYNMGITYQAR